MHITFSPVRKDACLRLERRGDTLLINDNPFDFAGLQEDSEVPPEAVQSDWVVGPVARLGGVLHLTLLLPHGAHAPHETLYPEPLVVEQDGEIAVPSFESADGLTDRRAP